jgi:hypothetical protein
MSAGEERRRLARSRLHRKRARSASDAELVDDTITGVRDSVERRNPPLDESVVNQVVSDEVRQMRAEKRARRWIFETR